MSATSFIDPHRSLSTFVECTLRGREGALVVVWRRRDRAWDLDVGVVIVVGWRGSRGGGKVRDVEGEGEGEREKDV